jgi:WD40 repeat protein
MTKLSKVMKDRLAQEPSQVVRHLSNLSAFFLCLCAWVLPGVCTATDLYVGNFFGPGNEDVLRYNGSTGASLGTFVPSGSGGLTFPLGGAFGPDGNLYVSNSDTDSVLRYNGGTGAFINTFTSPVEDAAGMKFGPDQNLYVANSTAPGGVTKINGTTGAVVGPLTGGVLSDPEGVVIGPDHNLYVANGDLNNVLRFNPTTGNFIDTFVSSGSGGLSSARGVAFGPDGDLYVTSFGTGQVLRYDGTTGAFLNAFVSAGSGGLSFPRDLVFGPDSNLYVGSFGTGSILRYNGSNGAFMDAFVSAGSGGLGGPTFLVFHDAASSAVPEPSAIGIIGLGLVGLGAWKWKTTGRK